MMGWETESAPVCPGVEIGTSMITSFEGIGTFKSILIGMEYGRYLIMKLPPMPSLPLKLYQQNYFVVRYFHNGSAYGFRTSLLGLVKEPVRLYILDYPARVESLNLRKQERHSCLLTAHVKMQAPDVDAPGWDGAIMDISTDGCRFQCMTPENIKLPNIAVGSMVEISFQLPTDDAQWMLEAEIRIFSLDQSKLTLGMRFEPPAGDKSHQDMMIAIQSFIDSLRLS